ncbi:MAG TPA: YtxH domain-containing protein, partial [Microthrixaceae bacterium]|nr:YtxH domain-containing protein [Microthrixaceae bacterium]
MLLLRPLGKFVIAAAIGAVLDYFLDPNAGRERRGRVMAQVRQILPGDHAQILPGDHAKSAS